MASVVAEIAPELDPHALITGGGSVKGNVVSAAKSALSPAQWGQFVPGHPIAGTERSGPDAAFATLFVDHRVILTPIKEDVPEMVARAVDLWHSVGAIVEQMDTTVLIEPGDLATGDADGNIVITLGARP
ncbi:cyclohexadienyl dehydrogenase [mine drainage metagenome]|uniref:Cyclohexadienyl dehydrogenase n=1 Tax=mine drainage metagenome TaxID=410659 RepID=A0A1J5P0L3_9ZZZZ